MEQHIASITKSSVDSIEVALKEYKDATGPTPRLTAGGCRPRKASPSDRDSSRSSSRR